jgi:hypothetical protein
VPRHAIEGTALQQQFGMLCALCSPSSGPSKFVTTGSSAAPLSSLAALPGLMLEETELTKLPPFEPPAKVEVPEAEENEPTPAAQKTNTVALVDLVCSMHMYALRAEALSCAANALHYKTLTSTEPTQLMGWRARCLEEGIVGMQASLHGTAHATCSTQRASVAAPAGAKVRARDSGGSSAAGVSNPHPCGGLHACRASSESPLPQLHSGQLDPSRLTLASRAASTVPSPGGI